MGGGGGSGEWETLTARASYLLVDREAYNLISL